MSATTEPRAGDPRLHPFLRAVTEAEASCALDTLIGGEVDRVVGDAVRRELGGSRGAAPHLDDVAGDVRLHLMRRLWSLRRGVGEPIDNVLGYAVIAAEHQCYAFLRRQYPERTRFRNRVRYAVAHHPGTTLARDAGGVWSCRTRQGVRRAPAAGAVQAFLDRPPAYLAEAGIDAASPLPTVINDLLARFEQPIELDRLVDALAAVLGVVDVRPLRPRDQESDPLDRIADPAPGIGDVLEQRAALLRVWNEVVELPARQRTALLLNLRDPEGGAVLQTLPATGVVTAAAIAAALEIDADALARLWEKLPLDDNSIAELLGLTRQQVINLRKSARARLARRLGGRISS